MTRWLTAMAFLALSATGLGAQEADEEEKKEGKYKEFAELTEGAEAQEGFLDFYAKDDKLYMAISEERLDEPFLMNYQIARGIGANGLFGGTMLNIFESDLMALERHGEKMFLVKKPHNFTGGDDEAAQRAVELTFGSSVVESASIESIREDGALVIEVQDWFLSDMSNISQRVRRAVSTEPGRPGAATFDRSRSYLESVKAFPSNVNVVAALTFKPGEPVGFPSVPDGRYLPIAVHYTLAQLPEQPMQPRISDDRVGSFMTVHKDFSQEDSTFFVRMSNRWRLEPGRRDGNLYRPVQPIVYHIDRTVPEEYRQAMKDGIEAWQPAFEAAGFKEAIVARDLPDDADAADIRYATLRWNVSDQVGYGAIGPSMVDPRTGEILDADLLFEANMFLGYRNAWRNMVAPVTAAEAFEQTLQFSEDDMAMAASGAELSSFSEAFMAQGGLLGTALAARGEIEPGDPMPDDYLYQAVLWVTMHEVGHSLGLQHNFRSSASTPFAQLHDKLFAEENGLFSSVMEYPTVNLAPVGQENGYYYTPGIGSYDRWAISYIYTPEQDRANQIARQAADKRHMFGTNAESGGPGALDPSINVYDLSDDPLTWGAERSELIQGLWENLDDYVLADNSRYNDLTVAFQSTMNEYARSVAPAVKYLGGQYINRDHKGDPNGRLPFANVPRAEQEKALSLLVDRVFEADALTLPDEVVQQFGANRWLHWGTNSTFNGRIDFPYHEQILGFQSSVMGQLLHPFRLSRIRDAEMKFGAANVVTIPELMDALTGAVWSELAAGGNIGALRRDLQRAWVDRMSELVVDPAERTPADASSVARMQLQRVSDRIEAATGVGTMDDYTTAHLAESRARVQRALDAGLEVGG